ncbi:MAG: type IV secretory system conjugative DNA transfer family protein [Clostridiales bacterium]|jgi:type IV secretion system protein VirD4|nr:type IV secretory system conjugative DNA transfer family protein [Clostridiales bacterium]
MKKKTGAAGYVVYGLLIVAALYFAAALGTAADLSKGEEGKIDFDKIDIEAALKEPKLVFSEWTRKKSTAGQFAFFTAFGIGIYALVKITDKKACHRRFEEHGSARWGTKGEAKKLLDKDKSCNIILTNDVKMSLNTRMHRENLNILVIGGAGSGKSLFFAKPNIMQMNTSVVATDPKGELLSSTGKMLEKNGYKVRVFNLIDMKHSHNYNPFNYVYDEKMADEEIVKTLNPASVIKMVNVFMKNTKDKNATGGDQFWDDATRSLLSALSFYLLETEPERANFGKVTELLKLAKVSEDAEVKSELDELFDELEENDKSSLAVSYYKDFKMAAGDTMKSILISCAARLQFFNLPEVKDLTHTDNLELDKLGDTKNALFVIIPASDRTFNFLAAMMYTQMFDCLYNRANFVHGGRLKVHARCILDEFANIGQIPDFDSLITTMRSMEISANVIIQNLAQLKAMYKDTWESIVGNCDSLLFLGGQEESTLKLLSEKLGKETIDIKSRNRTRGMKNNSSSENNSISGRELMTIDEISTMPMSDCLLFIRAYHPFYGKKFDTFKHESYELSGDFDKSNIYSVEEIATAKTPPEEDGANKVEAELPVVDPDIKAVIENLAELKKNTGAEFTTELPDEADDIVEVDESGFDGSEGGLVNEFDREEEPAEDEKLSYVSTESPAEADDDLESQYI